MGKSEISIRPSDGDNNIAGGTSLEEEEAKAVVVKSVADFLASKDVQGKGFSLDFKLHFPK